MNKFLILALASVFAMPASAASHSAAPHGTDRDSSGTATQMDGKSGSEPTGDVSAKPKKGERPPEGMEEWKNTGDRSATGSAAGVTGGPATTGGHTGSTNNPSNSPSPSK